MKKILVFVLSLLVGLNSYAADKELKGVKKKQAELIKSLNFKYLVALQKIQSKSVTEMKALLDKRLEQKNLDAANEISAAIERIKSELKNTAKPKLPSFPTAFERIVGAWGGASKEGGKIFATLAIMADGTARWDSLTGKVEITGKKVTIRWSNGRRTDSPEISDGEIGIMKMTDVEGGGVVYWTKLN